MFVCLFINVCLFIYLLTINTTSTPPLFTSRLYQNPSGREKSPNQSKSPRSNFQKKQQTLNRFIKWKIKSINNFAIHSKCYLNNGVYIFRSIYKSFKTIPSNPQTLNHSFLFRHVELVSYILKYSTTLIHCHFILSSLSFNFILIVI